MQLSSSVICPKSHHYQIMDTSFIDPSKSHYFPILFIILWIGICFLLSLISGWWALSKNYRANYPFSGKKLRMKSATMRWGTNYGGCLTIGANREGLYLAIFPIFRINHPPLFIPWNDISTETGKQFVFFNIVKFNFRKSSNIPLIVSTKLADRIFRMKDEWQT